MSQTGPLEQGKKFLESAAARHKQKMQDVDFEFDSGPLGCCILKQGASQTSQSGVSKRDCEAAANQNHLQCQFLPGQQCP